MKRVLVRNVFRVIAAGSHDPAGFGLVMVELAKTDADDFFPIRLPVRVTPKGRPPIIFDADTFAYEGQRLHIVASECSESWIFEPER